MITLSSELVSGLREESRFKFYDKAVLHAKEVLKEYAMGHDKEGVPAFVNSVLKKGYAALFLQTEEQLLDYVKICIVLGHNYEDDPFYTVLDEIIGNKESKTNTLSTEYGLAIVEVYTDTYKVDDKVYLGHYKNLKDAYVYKYKGIQKITYVEWKAIFKEYVPKESPLLEDDMLKARFEKVYYGLEKYACHSVNTTMVYSILAVRFGIGLDANPLYPKFGHILKSKELEESKKCMELIDTAIFYVDNEI
jgi:hypothetical protein